jgi:hypothetical protein
MLGLKKILFFFTPENIQKLLEFLKSIHGQYGQFEGHKIGLIIAEDCLKMAKIMSNYPAILKRMCQLMGFLPSSERSNSLLEDNEKPEYELSEEEKEAQRKALEDRCNKDPRYAEAQKKLKESNAEREKHQETIKKIKDNARKDLIKENAWKKNVQNTKRAPINDDLSEESIFTTPASSFNEKTQEAKVKNIQDIFGTTVGLHKTIEQTTRLDLKVILTKVTYNVETITDLKTGLSARGDVSAYGPAGFNVTWDTLVVLVKLHIGFAIPMNRLAMIIGHNSFASAQIYQLLKAVAKKFLNIYLVLFEELSDAPVLRGDDTNTKILETSDSVKKSNETNALTKMHEVADEKIGWRFAKKRGDGFKQKINTTIVIGRPEQDPRSTIVFFRAHFGSLGNLLSNILEYRRPSSGSVIIQGDSSSANLVSEAISNKIKIKIAGCMAHARRPFWRYREDDVSSCYFLIRAFALLAAVESRIKAKIRLALLKNPNLSKEEKDQIILEYRQRFSTRLWTTVHNFCKKMLGENAQVNTNISDIIVWPKGTPLNIAAQYVITHFDELTLYLKHADLFLTNNICERGIRYEQLMLDSCKFRKTRNGRLVFDILKTILSTSNFAKIEFRDYLEWVWKAGDLVDSDPSQFTPYSYAQYLDKKRKLDTEEIDSSE